MKQNKFMLVFAFVLIASMVLSACQPQTIIQTVEVTKEVEKVVKETQVVQVETTKIVESTKVVEVQKKSFSTPHPILSDLKVRQAMATCTNKVDVARAGYPLLSEADAAKLVMDTFIPKTHWAYAGDANITLYPFSVENGKKILADDGWTDSDEDGVVDKNGTVMALKFVTTNAAFRQAWAAVWEKQMAACGIQILRNHVPASWWFGDTTGLAHRDFELGAFAWVGQADPGGQTLWACDQIPTAENNWEGQNDMGWCNEKASEAIKNANNTLIKEDRIKWYTIVQQEYTKDVPAIPLFNRTETFSTAATVEGFNPVPGEEYYFYNVQDWVNTAHPDTFVLAATQEPASLYTVVESAFAAQVAAGLTGFPRADTSLNYDYKPYLVKDNPTLENGMAQNNTVEVKEGDKVKNAAGDVVELKAGEKVVDETGATVEFSGTPIKMKQLVVKYEFRDDIKWQDGSPISQGDLELAHKTACDKDSGNTSFITCDKVQDIKYEGTSYTVTWVPGDQDPLYFLAPWGLAPSKQPIVSEGAYKGKTLADVPAKDWLTLPEVTEYPWSFGAYMLKPGSWVKGDSITFEANPYFFLGAPKTPKFVIKFVSAENAEAQLLTGDVDMLDSTTLAGLDEQLVQAEKDGKVKNYVIPGATWEHIDINMWLP